MPIQCLTTRADGAHLSPAVLAGILAGVVAVILGLIIGLILLLIRAVRRHKRLLADLEERGIEIAQAQQDAKRDSITKPRTVLRRNTILPFNSKSGWGALPSVETINPPESTSMPLHYAPPKPVGFVSKPPRLSWPFSARRASGKAIRMRKIRVPRLSVVLENPKPSPLVPVLNGSFRGEPLSPHKSHSHSRPSSDQSLLQRHPAFRQLIQEDIFKDKNTSRELLRRSLTAKPVTKTEVRVRPNRSKSIAEIPISTKATVLSRLPQPDRHARSASMCSQSSGTAPEAPIPPLPLEVARLKTETRRRSLLSRSPSKVSVSSAESTGSSILVTQSSPILPGSTNIRVQKVTKRNWRNSMIVGPRPLRDTLTLHGKNKYSQDSIKSSAAHLSLASPAAGQSYCESRSSVLTNSSSMQSVGKVKTAESVTMSKISSPTSSPLTVRSLTTPRRKSGSHVTAYGSPEERQKRPSALQSVSGNTGMKRQLSEASTHASSTRSSNGNPFQWDPTPLASGKPSALKGSPSARKGHRRQNCVRISLAPTILGPPSRSPSPSWMKEIQEESPSASSEKRNSIGGLGFSNSRSLPCPPSTSIFAPDLKFNATSIRASLTPSSPTLSMANYDLNNTEAGSSIGTAVTTFASPPPDYTAYVLQQPSPYENKRLSTGSAITIPSFPSPCHGIGSLESITSPPPHFILCRTLAPPETLQEPSSPFEVLLEGNYPLRHTAADEYDPEHPYLVYQTPACSPTTGGFSSQFSSIPEEPSATSTHTRDYKRLQSRDSPPCSPKTIPAATFSASRDRSARNIPINDAAIPEVSLDTIDPAILSKDAFSTLNGSFNTTGGSIMQTSNSSRSSILIPTTPGSARSMFEPLLEAAFPSSPPVPSNMKDSSKATSKDAQADLQPRFELPTISIQSSPGSLYSSTSPPPSPPLLSPCSPRPGHAQLPAPSLNFANVPLLSPSILGPRGSPPRPLRTSIQKLRRMNSDADEKGGKAERRYLRLGREESIALPGEETWLDELDEEEYDGGLDEEKGRHLVGDILDDWEEEATVLQLDIEYTKTDKGKDNSNNNTPTQGQVPSSPSASRRSSSIWENGERFWQSTPPHPPTSPNKPKQHFLPLCSSPVSTPTPKSNRKRHFEVAKDASLPISPNEDTNDNSNSSSNSKKASERTSRDERRRSVTGSRYRKRSALGVSTPNVRIQVQPPSGGFQGTPGSLYDADGFLQV